jgi:glycosyltransferase involved in cell wall biosynthesis
MSISDRAPCRTIGIYGEDLAVYTSSTQAREMLRELIFLRVGDRFLFLFRKGSLDQDWVREYLRGLPQERVTAQELPWSRRSSNIRALIGLAETECSLPKADVYLRFDVGGLGRAGHPLIDGIADLSALNPRQSSLAWHGRALFKRALRRTLLRGGDTVVISAATKDDVLTHFPQARGYFHVIPNGIANEWFELGAVDAERLEDAWVWYGQVTPRKNLSGLIEAYATLQGQVTSRLPRLKLITRPGAGASNLAELASTLGLADAVHFVNPLPLCDLINAVKTSRGLVFPSFHEGFGMPIAEAMACGRPVLTSNTTSMPEVAGGHALLCDPGSRESMMEGLHALLDPAIDEISCRTARRKHSEKFTTQNSANSYNILIDQVLCKDPTR